MTGRLQGKIAIVTGAGSGIGRAMAERFVKEGARVICADVSGHQDELAQSLGEAAVGLHVDVASSADVQRMIATAEERFGRLDILCNNAGFSGGNQPLHEHSDDHFDKLVAINLRGVFLGMKYGVISMLKTGGGTILNTASSAGIVGWKGISGYSATKGGVVQISKSAALDYAEQNIRVNAICPGMTWTLLASRTELRAPPAGTPDLPNVPMKRWGLAEELANTALFLVSDEASYVTGAVVPVDGGLTTG
jgi:NAD(P)-dependent dehydrogenase (short-subunit alcohol dehydrogenase family)